MAQGAPDDASVGGTRLDRALINPTFARLFSAMLVSSIGDWAGIIAVTVLVARLGGSSGGAYAVAAVMVARLLPLLAFGPFAGVLVDRFDRRRLMVVADGGRAIAYALIPLFGLPGILVASFCIEALALLWGPALDAALPNVVPCDALPKANSINLLTSYGTLPVGALVFTGLTALAPSYDPGALLGAHPESLALWVDAASFAVSALIVSRVALGRAQRSDRPARAHRVRRDLVDEWRLLGRRPRARALMGSLVAAFAAAGALTALGPLFMLYTLGSGEAGYGVVITALGLGLAGGMMVLIRRSGRTALDPALTGSLLGVTLCLGLLTLTTSVWTATAVTFALGAAGGTAWVSAYTLLQQEVTDEYRGRTFALLTVSARAALLLSRVLFPLLAGAVGSAGLADRAGSSMPDGNRVAFGAAALLMLAATALSRRGRPARAGQ